MRLLATIIILFFLYNSGLCQGTSATSDSIKIYKPSEFDKPGNFTGGDKKLNQFIKQNLIYPKQALKDKAKGLVIIEFTLDELGNISNPRFIGKETGPFPVTLRKDLQEEALRVTLLSSGKWYPAIKDGKQVKSYSYLPIRFGRK